MPPRALGLCFAGLTVCIFAGWFVVTRFAVTHTLRAWDITAFRFGIGLLCLGPALLRGLPRGALRRSAPMAVLWGAPFVLVLAFGLGHSSAAEASAITPCLMPVFAGLFGWVALGARPGRLRLAGFAGIVAGVALLVVAIAGHGVGPSLSGLGPLLAASAMWAGYTVLFRGGGLSPVQAAGLICLWSSVAYLPLYLALGLSRIGQAAWGEVAFQALYQGVLMSAVGIVTFNRAVVLLGPGAASAIVALLPVVATLLAIPVLGEVPGPLDAVALAVIAGGVLLAARPAPA